MSKLRTAESVSPKHPDKICDQISDAILDAHLAEDPDARVAIDVAGGHGAIFITGEITSKAKAVDVIGIVERLAGDMEIHQYISHQSPEISRGVDGGGAGDQGIMIGYATNETPEKIPLEVVLARRLNQYLFELWPYDGKTQVTLKNNVIETIVASFQHAPTIELTEAVKQWANTQDYVNPTFVKNCNDNPRLYINPAGDWQIGGFDADAGLTGRKLAVDNYGPSIPVGGGAFSGKDASKVDRSAAYMARRIAVDYLAKFQAREVYVTLAYAIGFAEPVQASAIVDGVEKIIDGYDLTPCGIVATLDLKRPQFEATATWGHFGHNSFSWR